MKILPYLLQAVESASLDIVGPLVSFLLQNRTYVEGNVNRPKKKEAKFFFACSIFVAQPGPEPAPRT